MLKVYFAAPMLGDRSNLEDNRKIASALKAMGCEILTEWVLEEVLDIERGATPKEIFERDIEILDKCDVLLADVSYPSLGVGFEIAYALLKGKKVVAYCREDRLNRTSALIRGVTWSNFTLVTYRSVEELVAKISKVISAR
ncbi:MAG TPA: hypothetical protein ENF55_01835 [Thermoprotei archaeon]|nr:MAG: hypothetical protein DRJ63_04680 [Thermoprotei archaeon]HDI74677.1 hypothetical protein [Thermoprotei archaeon]